LPESAMPPIADVLLHSNETSYVPQKRSIEVIACVLDVRD
jgi:hypothetical protein